MSARCNQLPQKREYVSVSPNLEGHNSDATGLFLVGCSGIVLVPYKLHSFIARRLPASWTYLVLKSGDWGAFPLIIANRINVEYKYLQKYSIVKAKQGTSSLSSYRCNKLWIGFSASMIFAKDEVSQIFNLIGFEDRWFWRPSIKMLLYQVKMNRHKGINIKDSMKTNGRARIHSF